MNTSLNSIVRPVPHVRADLRQQFSRLFVWCCCGLFFLAAQVGHSACSTDVTFGFKTLTLNGEITATLNGATVSASHTDVLCYSGIYDVSSSVSLTPNKSYTATLTWGTTCTYTPGGLSFSNGCACYALVIGNGVVTGDATNGSVVMDVMLRGTNLVRFSPESIVPDKISTAFASPEDPRALGSNITWSIEEPTLGCEIASVATNGEWCIIRSGTNEGSITVTAVGSTGCEASGPLELKKCSSCSTCEPGTVNPGLGSIDVTIDLGVGDLGQSAGSLSLRAYAPSSNLYSPQSLTYNWVTEGVGYIRAPDLSLRQLYAPGIFVNVVSNSPIKYTIELCHRSQLNGFSGGLLQYSNAPFAAVTVENPDATGATTNGLRITDSRDGIDRVSEYTYTGSGVWQLATGSGTKTEMETTTVSGSIRTVVYEVKSGGGQTIALTTRRYEVQPWGEGLIEEVHGSGPSALTNSYEYYTNGFLRQAVRADGSWEHYLYDDQWRPTNIFSAWLNQGPTTNPALCRLTQKIYDASVVSGSGDDGSVDPFLPRCVIECVQGTEVARRYTAHTPHARREEICQAAGASWNASGNMATLIQSYPDGPFRGLTKTVARYDTIWSEAFGELHYYADSTNGIRTNTVLSGLAYLDLGNWVFDEFGGIASNITVRSSMGEVILHASHDAISGFTNSYQLGSEFDDSGHATRVTYLDGTSTLTYHGCCGNKTVTNREGTVTVYGIDSLKRPITTTANGITISNVLDAAGRTLAVLRFGTDNSIVTNSGATFDLASQVTSSTDALGNVTAYTNYIDGSGYRVRQTTYADGGVRVERWHRDGSLYDISGTAAFAVTYAYGPTNDGQGRMFTSELRNGGSEWTMTIHNMLGRHHKTVYAAASAPFPTRQTFYDNLSQVWKETDPDGVAILYIQDDNWGGYVGFNGRMTAIDVDRDDQIDGAETDRIKYSLTGTYDATFRRTTEEVWSIDNANGSTVESTMETTADGLQTRRIVAGLTNSTTTFYAGGGYRYVTNTSPDGTSSLNTFKDGRLTATDASHPDIGSLSALRYGYDAHGRQSSVTNLANGTVTTWLYDKADQVVTNTITASGLTAQTTASFYDNRGRIWRTILSDGGSVTNEYYTNGLLKKTYGTRTYPVQYSYDSQGRLTNMTTWQNFAAGTGTAATAWQYDAYRGFMTNKLYADGNGTGYAYTNSGRLVKRTWARGVTTSYGYNSAGDLSVVDYSDSTTDLSYTYHRRGWPSAITQGSTTTTLAYGDAGNLLTESYSGGPLTGLSLLNDYDSLYRRVTNSLWNGSSRLAQTRYTYDAASRLFAVSDGTNSASYTYLTNSPLVSQISFTNAGALRMTTTKQFDGFHRLTNVVSTPSASGQPPDAFSYSYNSANQDDNATRGDGTYWVYQYDSLGLVTSGKKFWSDGTSVAGQQFEYAHDDLGNRKTAASGGDQWGANLRHENYTANNLNQYTQRTVSGSVDVLGAAHSNATVTVNLQPTYRKGEYYRANVATDNSASPVWLGLTNVGVLLNGTNADIATTNAGHLLIARTPEIFTYDLDGNLTSNGTWTNTWNGENRWIAAENRSEVPTAAREKVEFLHDAFGRRIQKIVSTNNGSSWVAQSTNKFVYDVWNLIAELDTSNKVVRAYMWGVDLSGRVVGGSRAGGLVAMNAGSNGTHFYAYDRRGNVSALVSATDGTNSARYDYGRYGELLVADGPLAASNPFHFRTGYQDEQTGTLSFGYGDYHPASGQGMSRAPLAAGVPTLPSPVITPPALYTPPSVYGPLIEGGIVVAEGITAGEIIGVAGSVVAIGGLAPILGRLLYPEPPDVTYPNPYTDGRNAPPDMVKQPPDPKPDPVDDPSGDATERPRYFRVPLPVPMPEGGVNPSCPERDKCKEDCHKQYDEAAKECRKLPTPQERAKCWERIGDQNRDCIANCNKING